MTDRGEIRIDRAPPPARPRWPAGAAVAVAGFLAALAVLGGPGGSADPETGQSLPDPDRELLEDAGEVAAEFAAAWNRGDGAAAAALIADDWDTVVLPGFADPWFDAADGRPALDDGIGFLAAVSRLELGPCYAEIAPPESRAAAVVSCFEASFESDYLEAIQRDIWAGSRPQGPAGSEEAGIRFEVRGGRITAITGPRILYSPQAYCIWAEAGSDAGAEFDLHCRPIARASSGAAHARAAAAFIAAGAPLPGTARTEARLAATYPDRFVELHNLGDTLTIRVWLSSRVRAADLPGYPGSGDDPPLTRYLLWSSRLFEIQIGRCTVDLEAAATVVTCPDLLVTGPVLDAPVPQPTRFTVARPDPDAALARGYGRILAIEPLSDTPVTLQPACRRLRESGSDAATAFDENCSPIFTLEAADALRSALRA